MYIAYVLNSNLYVFYDLPFFSTDFYSMLVVRVEPEGMEFKIAVSGVCRAPSQTSSSVLVSGSTPPSTTTVRTAAPPIAPVTNQAPASTSVPAPPVQAAHKQVHKIRAALTKCDSAPLSEVSCFSFLFEFFFFYLLSIYPVIELHMDRVFLNLCRTHFIKPVPHGKSCQMVVVMRYLVFLKFVVKEHVFHLILFIVMLVTLIDIPALGTHSGDIVQPSFG